MLKTDILTIENYKEHLTDEICQTAISWTIMPCITLWTMQQLLFLYANKADPNLSFYAMVKEMISNSVCISQHWREKDRSTFKGMDNTCDLWVDDFFSIPLPYTPHDLREVIGGIDAKSEVAIEFEGSVNCIFGELLDCQVFHETNPITKHNAARRLTAKGMFKT